MTLDFDKRLIREATYVFDGYGLNLSEAIEAFLKECVIKQKIPFSISEEEKYIEALNSLSKKEINGYKRMTLEEINEEIALARKERQRKKGNE